MKISNYAKAIIFLLLLTTLGCVYAQSVPSSAPEPVSGGGGSIDTGLVFIYALIVI